MAQKAYEETLSSSREGLSIDGAELARIDDIISPRLKKGQSIHAVCATEPASIGLSERTVYKYLHLGALSADLFDTHRILRRKERKKAGPHMMVDKKCRVGRTYEDFEKYLIEHPDTNVVEMDTIEGKKGELPVVLSLLFRNCDLQLFFLRDANTAKSVTEVFCELRKILTPDEFTRLFGLILTDRGTEFSDPKAIEIDSNTNIQQSHVFYCDPEDSNQKAKCERNHEHFRYILPKGTSFLPLTKGKTTLITNHVSSYVRKRLGDKTPLFVFRTLYGDEVAKKLGLVEIAPADVTLTPDLIK